MASIVVKVRISDSKDPELYRLIEGTESGGRAEKLRKLANAGISHEVRPAPSAEHSGPQSAASSREGQESRGPSKKFTSFKSRLGIAPPKDEPI